MTPAGSLARRIAVEAHAGQVAEPLAAIAARVRAIRPCCLDDLTDQWAADVDEIERRSPRLYRAIGEELDARDQAEMARVRVDHAIEDAQYRVAREALTKEEL